MKKVLMVLVSLVLFGSFAVAQAVDDKKADMPMTDQQMMMTSGDGKGMMDCPMMKGADGKGMMDGMMKQHQMMMHDMMQMMKDMMAIQKKMLIAAAPEDKAQMGKDLSVMTEKMDKMMASPKCMMMDMQQPASEDQKKQDSRPAEHKH
jgi:acetylornithine/succinyldiaminopimelate/putrescine aminotransferase